MNPKISIVVPVYNVENYLYQCLNSLVNQTLEEIEIIVVNDGSTDQSSEILSDFEKHYPHKIKCIHQVNQGISAARNNGVTIATGEYLAFIDSDDFIELNTYEELLNLANNADIVLCDIEYYWDSNNAKNYVMKGLSPLYNDVKMPNRALLSPLFSWNKIFKREFYLKNNITFHLGTWYEDLEPMTFMLAMADEVHYLEKTLIHYRQRNNSIMSSRNEKCKDIFDVLEDIVVRFKENDLFDKFEKELEYLFIENLLLFGQYRFLALNDYKELIVQSKSFVKKYFPNYLKNPYIKKVSLKNKIMLYFNNRYTCSLFRKYLFRKVI